VNLLSNAFRHNPPNTTVSVAARELPAAGSGQPEVEVIVADDGRGFPGALAAAPFEASQRHRSRSSGAGLGLSIANGIVIAHEGRIALEPVEVGTSFRIRLRIEASTGDAHGGGHDGGAAAPAIVTATSAPLLPGPAR
jgi:signal transduction histidine kinase